MGQKRNNVWFVLIIFSSLFAGQSPIDFLFDFVEVSQGVFTGFDVLETRPKAGKGASKCELDEALKSSSRN